MKIVPVWENKALDPALLRGACSVLLSGCGFDWQTAEVVHQLGRLGRRGCQKGGLVVWITRDDYGFTSLCECRHCLKLVSKVRAVLEAGLPGKAVQDAILRRKAVESAQTFKETSSVVRPSRPAIGRR
jgi:hypothetical protein